MEPMTTGLAIAAVAAVAASLTKSIAESIEKYFKRRSTTKITIQRSDGTKIETVSVSDLQDPEFAKKLIERLNKDQKLTK
jgi:outer membrane lipoprotein SlyB